MSALAAITTGTTPQPRRILLFGVQGVGKSTFATNAPAPIAIQTEDGLGDIDCHKFPLARSFDDVLAQIAALYQDGHGYRTVVIDSLDWLERLILAEVCRVRQVATVDDIPYSRGYQFALTYWKQILDGLTALRAERGMTVILIAHARIEAFNNPETEAYDRYVPRLHKAASALVCEWCDEVLFATYRVFTRATDEGFNQKRVHGIGTGERVLKTTERPAHVAKNRLGLPDELPLSWTDFARHLAAARAISAVAIAPEPAPASAVAAAAPA